MIKKIKLVSYITFLMVILHGNSLIAMPKVINILNIDLFGGNSYINGQTNSFGADFVLDWVPVLEFNENFSILPRYCGTYRGNKSLLELEGGGTLYQQLQDHNISVKFLKQFPEAFSLNATLFYMLELARETTDENWLDGLYNYNNGGIDIEAKKVFFSENFPSNLSYGYSFYKTTFPNYSSLASTQYGQELMGGGTGIGNYIFDNYVNELAACFDILVMQKGIFKSSYILSNYNYPDQKVVNISGDYTELKRNDLLNHINVSIDFFFSEFSIGNKFSFAPSVGTYFDFDFFDSNQNYYDVGKYRPTLKFYNYCEQRICLPLNLQFSEPIDLNTSISFQHIQKQYSDRVVQDSLGDYGTEKLQTSQNVWSWNFQYPLPQNFTFIVNLGFISSFSNMRYEKLYLYNFEAWNYSAGIRYEY